MYFISKPNNPGQIIILSENYKKTFLLIKFTLSYDNKMIQKILVLLSKLSGLA